MEDEINRLYKELLFRQADKISLHTAIDYLSNHGGTLELLERNMKMSQEYKEKHVYVQYAQQLQDRIERYYIQKFLA